MKAPRPGLAILVLVPLLLLTSCADEGPGDPDDGGSEEEGQDAGQDGDVLDGLVVKDGDGDSPVYRAAAPLAIGSSNVMEQVIFLRFGQGDLPGDTTTTGGDISAAGDLIAIRTYDSAFLWRRVAGASIAEALGFAADGSGYDTLSEGQIVPLHWYPRP